MINICKLEQIYNLVRNRKYSENGDFISVEIVLV